MKTVRLNSVFYLENVSINRVAAFKVLAKEMNFDCYLLIILLVIKLI